MAGFRYLPEGPSLVPYRKTAAKQKLADFACPIQSNREKYAKPGILFREMDFLEATLGK
jgi:hypothetical protein